MRATPSSDDPVRRSFAKVSLLVPPCASRPLCRQFFESRRSAFRWSLSRPGSGNLFWREGKGEAPDDLELTTIFSPLVANQEPTRPVTKGVRNEIWSLVVNADELRDLPYCEIAAGNGLPWKLAMWGSGLDEALLDRLRRKWACLEDCEAHWNRKERRFERRGDLGVFGVGEGPELKDRAGSGCVEVSEIHGKPILDVDLLKRARRIFSFDTISLPLNARKFLNTRHGWKGIPLSNPPHVMVSAARNYAVFWNNYLLFKNRQIGIVHVDNDPVPLKALALYLSSDFAYYHQFLTTTELGIKRDRATLEALRRIPLPILELPVAELGKWEKLHDQLVKTTPRILTEPKPLEAELDERPIADGQDNLIEKLNCMVFDALGLDKTERALVEDLIGVRLSLNDGKLGKDAMADVKRNELEIYAQWLRDELDNAVEEGSKPRHAVSVIHDGHSGFVAIDLTTDHEVAAKVRVLRADATGAATLARTRAQLRRESAQWVYFDRALRIYRPHTTYLFKPIQRMHWTRTRAMLDAADIIIGRNGEE